MVKRRIRRSMRLRHRKRITSRTPEGNPLSVVSFSRMGLGKMPHFFKRTFRSSYGVTDTFTNRANIHMLSNLPNASEFSALFDCYRISKISAKFIYSQNTAVTPTSATNFIPSIVYVVDTDDGTPLTDITQYEQYETFKIRRLDRPFTVSVKPKIAQSAYSGGAFSGYVRPVGLKYWCDAASPNIEHYALKYGIRGDIAGGAGTNTLGQIDIYWTYYITCKDVQ